MRLAMDTRLRPDRLPVLKVLSRIGHIGQSPPFVELKTTVAQSAALRSTWPGEGWHSRLPPRHTFLTFPVLHSFHFIFIFIFQNSFTILLWYYVEHVGSAARLDLLSLRSVDSASLHLSVALASAEGKLIVQSGVATTPAELPANWQRKKWHHLALVTSRKRFQVFISPFL
jgi:hypothetical protein